MSAEEEAAPLLSFADAYEVVNLREGLLTLRALGLDTGDWLGQILNRLPANSHEPNVAVAVQVASVRKRMRDEPIF